MLGQNTFMREGACFLSTGFVFLSVSVSFSAECITSYHDPNRYAARKLLYYSIQRKGRVCVECFLPEF